MKNCDWKNAFGEPSETFRHQLVQTLNGLEEREMKKRYKLSTLLVAALIVTIALAAAGFALDRLRLFDTMKESALPREPLPGVEELVALDLGRTENEYAVLTVEEAVFDGQGMIVEYRLSPKNPEKYGLLNSFMQNLPEELYIIEEAPMKVPEGRQEFVGGSGTMTMNQVIINENGKQQILIDGKEIEIPATSEEALRNAIFAYKNEEGFFYAGAERAIITRRDGREILNYGINARTNCEVLGDGAVWVEEQEDGSIIWWATYMADTVLNLDEITLEVTASILKDDARYPFDPITITLPKIEDERSYMLVPVNVVDTQRFGVISGNLICTKVQSYIEVSCAYEQNWDTEPHGITLYYYDANGNKINTGDGTIRPEGNTITFRDELEAFALSPETIWVEAKVIGEIMTLGRVECRLVAE